MNYYLEVRLIFMLPCCMSVNKCQFHSIIPKSSNRSKSKSNVTFFLMGGITQQSVFARSSHDCTENLYAVNCFDC